MAKQRYVRTSFWTDNYIENLSPREKLVFLYLLTNESTNLCGVYEISIKRICFETGINENDVNEIMTKLSEDKKIFYIDGYVCITNFTKHQSRNPSVDEGIRRETLNIPQSIIDKIESIIDGDMFILNKLPLSKRNIGRKSIGKGTVKRIHELDGHKCVVCSSDDKKYLETHHIIPQSRGGTGKDENLVTICAKCHNDLHKLERTDIDGYITACQSLLQPVARCRTLLNLTLPNLTKPNSTDQEQDVPESKLEILNFLDFWNLYNKKVGNKDKAEKIWKSLKIDDQKKIMETLPFWLKNIKDKQFQPYPTSYLNGKRWNDVLKYSPPLKKDPPPVVIPETKPLTEEEKQRVLERLNKFRGELHKQFT